MKNNLIAVITISLMAIVAACNPSTKNEKKGWTDMEKKEYVNSCINSASKMYKQAGMKADAEMLKSVCECSMSKVEAQLAFAETKNMSDRRVMTITKDIMRECMQEWKERQEAK